MPTLRLAVLVLLARFSISQMDVLTRQSYLMAVVSSEERSAAAGIAGLARTIGAAISPLFVGFTFARPALIDLPFFIAGTLRITCDLLLYRVFVAVHPPEEMRYEQRPCASDHAAAKRIETASTTTACLATRTRKWDPSFHCIVIGSLIRSSIVRFRNRAPNATQ